MEVTVIQNPLERLLGYQLRRASAAMLADLAEALADIGLSVTEMSVLMQIEANSDITQSEIGRILAIKRANMAPMTASLLERGLVAREAADGRSQALRLTDEGRTACAEAGRRIAAHEAKFLSDLVGAERDALIALLSRVWSGEQAKR